MINQMQNKRGAIALSEILILVLGIIAIGYALGSEVGGVSGQEATNAAPISWIQNLFGIKGGTSNAVTPAKSITPPQIIDIAQSYTEQGFMTSEALYNKLLALTLQNNQILVDAKNNFFIVKDNLIYPATYDGTNVITNTGANPLALGKDGVFNNEHYHEFNTAKPIEGQLYKSSVGADATPQPQEGPFKAVNKFFPNSPGVAYAIGNIAQGFAWGMAVGMAAQFFLPLLGMDEKQSKVIGDALTMGIIAGKTTQGIMGGLKTAWRTPSVEGGWTTAGKWGTGVGIAVALYMFYQNYKETTTKIVTFECHPWEAPTGGKYCEDCNKGDFPCGEYQCKSLGQACELIDEKCVWKNPQDVKPPEMKPWKEALLYGYKYEKDNVISPPDVGVKIIQEGSSTGCVKAFAPLTFGINTNEPSRCRIDYDRQKDYDTMKFAFGESTTLMYNHSQGMALPGPNATSGPILQNDKQYSLYTRCQDANGNTNTGTFVFKFCVEKGPDATAPIIVTTSLLNGMPIGFNQSSVDLDVYINEPANCKWAHQDKIYSEMENTMLCSTGILEFNAQMLYKCSTTLSGLKDRQNNEFYFRCEDTSAQKNVNSESYKFTLIGTQPLTISSIKPNATIKDSTDLVKAPIEVETSAGYKEGEAICYFSEEKDGSYIEFSETHSHKHKQDLFLPSGSYTYYIKCVDLGGNSDTAEVSFNVESDSVAPMVARVYHEESYLKIITNEPARCVYSNKDCNFLFDDGLKMANVKDTEHFTDWNVNTDYYIKCKDEYGNQPMPNQCNIIVRPSKDFFGKSSD
ncbi:MAG: hypothetical protein KKA64_04905 [Nanoarchaeota archaeon]|nr:hypothetical protein [Nanoarchaeota archaeon]